MSGKVDIDDILDAAEDATEDLIASGVTEDAAFTAIGNFLEDIDDAVPVLDRAFGAEDYSRIARKGYEAVKRIRLRDPVVAAARRAFRDEWDEQHDRRKGWRKAWKRSPERKVVKS